MRWFGQKNDGWLALAFHPERVDVAHVQRRPGARPQVTRLESFARQGEEAALLATLRKQRELGRHVCTTVLEPGAYQLVQVPAPAVPPEEMAAAVRWGLKDALDFPVDNATVDVLPIPLDEAAGRTPQVFAVAADNTRLAPRIQSCDAAGLALQAVDVPELAQRNLAALVEEENRGLAFLTFDAAGGMLTVTWRGELYLSRRIDISSTQLQVADSERRTALFERIGLELQRSLDNFERVFSFISVSRLAIGPGSLAEPLAAFLRDYVYIPVDLFDLAAVLDCSATPELREPALQAERLLVVGAALRTAGAGEPEQRSPQQINLLNSALRPQREWLTLRNVALALVLVLLAEGLAFAVQRQRNAALAQELTSLQARSRLLQEETQTLGRMIGERQPDPALAEEIARTAQALAQREEALRALEGPLAPGAPAGDGGSGGFARVMLGFARQTVDGVWLTGFTIGGERMEIRGRMLDAALLPAYIRRLNGEPIFNARQFAALDMKGIVPAAPGTEPAGAASGVPAAPTRPYVEFVLKGVDPSPAGGRMP